MLDDEDKWFRVSLRLSGDSLKPGEVESLLGLETDGLGVKGTPRLGKNGREYAPWETNFWLHKSRMDSSVGFDEQIRELFELLADRATQLRELCDDEGIHGELFLGFSSGNGQGGGELSREILKLTVDAGLSISLDLYPPTIDDDEDFELVDSEFFPFKISS